ncbi:beta-lactamase family protein [Sphingomonas sp. BT-65]|uniref:serine hydrolase domain-containing protein n=1 Tax=Sphingomonas sp. BT-65 TaxID=2989821 RepID=UPI0022365159|nr:serine hydrolase domain-containing protein [Sphingomonas sp. BT-65]MCW4460563.1 beta-lactamase family protein [Sphingomonas sp. BT-65]
MAFPAAGEDDPRVDSFVRANNFHGVVVTARGGRITYARAFGMADIAAGRPATVDTIYGIASISKWLTSVTALKLVEQGRMTLETPISALLPEFRADTGARVKLVHLLSNTSGIPNGFIAAAKLDSSLVTTDLGTAESVRRFCQGDLVFEPGSRFDYAMTNWFLLVAIVERLTGKAFQDAMRAITLDPLGLRHTRADAAAPAAPGTALSYRTTEPPVIWPDPRTPVMAAGGGYFSNAGDLVRAAHGVFDLGFLRPESLAALRMIRVPEQDYSLGGRVRMLTIAGKPVQAAWETGRTAGFRSVLGHRYDDGSTVVILNNTGLSQKLLDDFADQMFGAAPRPA